MRLSWQVLPAIADADFVCRIFGQQEMHDLPAIALKCSIARCAHNSRRLQLQSHMLLLVFSPSAATCTGHILLVKSFTHFNCGFSLASSAASFVCTEPPGHIPFDF
ncbi:unnamed protein product [Polarella glacialis]|uniref:Uncharacterized protein n=1 Tax=Polarella glacialis TaxID=89957 RepID=A0A813EJF5_POLGL|nr:unnamed protein product [Polarella glacialis]